LGSIKVPYHLLQVTGHFSNYKQSLNEYYDKMIWCLKQAEATAIPLEKIKVKTRKPKWVLDPELKVVKNRAKFWLRIWASCGQPN
jgi:beta-xylosidase